MSHLQKWIRIGALPTTLVLLIGCTYGPETERAWLGNVARKPDAFRFAVAVQYQHFRPPTGISRFPDGGKPRFVRQAGLLYLVDAQTGMIELGARVDAPQDMRTAFGIHVDGWRRDTVFFTISGCPGNECDGGQRRLRHFQLPQDGRPEVRPARPGGFDRPPNMLARAPGETHYMRMSVGHQSLCVRTEPGGPLTSQYLVEDSGNLVRVLEAADSTGTDGSTASRCP